MKIQLIILFVILSNLSQAEKHIIFLHNKFLETHSIHEAHPDYGKVELKEITEKFKSAGFSVIADKRTSVTSMDSVIRKVISQIDSLIKIGTLANEITIVGTSKGGYIAQIISSRLKNTDLNFIFIGCFQESDLIKLPQINYCGNILTIYEESDPYGVSAIKRKQQSNLPISNFKEIQLNTGLNHGFLFKALDLWINPCIEWANGNYK